MIQGRSAAKGGAAPQVLDEELTLSQPGGRLYPPQYYDPLGFSDLATAMQVMQKWKEGEGAPLLPSLYFFPM